MPAVGHGYIKQSASTEWQRNFAFYGSTVLTYRPTSRSGYQKRSGGSYRLRQSLMVTVGMSKLDYTELMLVDPALKVDGVCYVLLHHDNCYLPGQVSVEFIFQQDQDQDLARHR